MRKKHLIKEAYIELAIIFTLVVFVGYSFLYLYSTTGSDKVIKLTDNACIDLGGACRTDCYDNEIEKSECHGSEVCCIPLFNASPEDKIYFKYAISSQDLNRCNQIVDISLRSECKIKVMDSMNKVFAIKYEDRKYCDLIENQDKKDDCIVELAIKTKHPKLCSSLKNMDHCLKLVAESSNEAKVCLEIKSEALKNICIKNIAVSMKDKDLCDMISKEEADDCRLKIDLINNIKDYVKCIELKESQCKNASMCKPLYYKTDCTDCSGLAFEICLPDEELLCEQNGGQWNILREECHCIDKRWYRGFGCISCEMIKDKKNKLACLNNLT
jgi:hypothetical protein